MSALVPRDFIVFDVETTGLSPRFGDRVVEVAALRVRDMEPVDEFHTLVNPGRPVSYGAYRVNRISDEMLRTAPVPSVVFPALLEFLGGACLVGHNVGFDIAFLANEIALTGRPLAPSFSAVDTVRVARQLMPGLASYSLASVSQAMGIERDQRHRALADVRLTYMVFRRLLEIAGERPADRPFEWAVEHHT